ncbi:protein glass-like [Anastrepha ludens]|uniref:protein glass-like n=1 Tax=Anastrepha ludens TaxID=28586 RepID=UPI0023AFFC16|nr:protein glass-like [Anastrepha ludens]
MGSGSHLRRNLRVKTSPPSSPVCTPVIKYEPAPSADDNESDLAGVASLGMGSQTGTISVGIASDNSAILASEGADDDQPCDLRLSSFRMNLVSMALQQAAAAVISGGSVTSPAGMQQAALQSIAATPSTHLSSLINFPHSHTPTHPQLPTQTSAQPRSITPTRRYSTSTTTGATAVGVGTVVVPSNRVASPLSGNMNTGSLATTSSSSATSGPSTSAAAAAAAAAANSALMPGGSGSDEILASSGVGVISNSGSAIGSSHIASVTTGSGGTFGGAYTCERCGNSYARPHSLNRHMRFECGVEPKFECPICHKKSKHKHNLVLHMRTHQHR